MGQAFSITQVYNLAVDSTGVSHYSVELSMRVQAIERRSVAASIIGGVMDAIGTTAAGDEQLTLTYQRQLILGDRDRVTEFLAVNLNDAPNGVYSMDLTVTDLANGQSFKTPESPVVGTRPGTTVWLSRMKEPRWQAPRRSSPVSGW